MDPRPKATYVLVREEVYERIKGLLSEDGEWAHDELRLLLAQSAEGNGWTEPAMDAYDHYDENRPCG